MIDQEDGQPVWDLSNGGPTPGGFQAWERLDVGPQCESWLVWSPQLWTLAVLKLTRPHMASHPQAIRSLRREEVALRNNPHPVLPRLYHSGDAGETHYVAVEYVRGPSLADELDDRGQIPADEAALLGIQLLTALLSLHQRGLAHVDVKPDNIALRDGLPVLMDLGSVREIGAKQPARLPVGPAGYAPPAVETSEPISAAMDVSALGATLRGACGEPLGLLDGVIDRMCEPDPARRLSSRAALAALAALFSNELRPWPSWATSW